MEQPLLNKSWHNALKTDWLKAVYIIFIILALVTRLWALGDRVQSHDESIHALYSWNLYTGRGFQHHPLMHGPLMFHVTALFYFLFGDNDFVARMPVALIGVAIVAFPYFLRRWLGRAGAIATSFFLLISPAIAYYSRYFRHDIPAILWALIVVLSIFSYLHDGRPRWLYLLAAGASLMFATKEVFFIYSAIFGLFLVGFAGIQAMLREWVLETLKPAFLLALAATAVGLLILGAGIWARHESPIPAWWAISGGLLAGLGLLATMVFLVAGQLSADDLKPPSLVVTLALTVTVLGLLFRLGLPELFSILSRTQAGLQGYAIPTQVHATLTLLPVIIGILILGTWYILRAFRSCRAFDLAVVLGTLCLPFLSPAIIKWGAGLDPMDYNAPTLYYSFSILIEVLFFSVAVGLMWGRLHQEENGGSYTWLVAAAIHYAIFLVFFTTFFTNGYGVASGLIGSLGYWLEQQGVKRGGQPWYYYILMVLFYEFLPLLLTCVAAVYLAMRKLLHRTARSADLPTPASPTLNLPTPDLPITHLPIIPFLLWWVAFSWLGYSYAGEKMPWLTTHVTLPMILLSGWLLGRFIERIDWREVMRRRAWLLALVAPPFVMAVAMFIRATAFGPFRGYGLAQLHTSGQFIGASAGVLILGTILGYLIWRSGWRIAVAILVLVALIVPVGLTIRTTQRFCYLTDEYPTEFLVYAHAAPGVSEAMRQITTLSNRITGDPTGIKVAYGADGSTLWYWQLRNFNADYYGTQPSREQMDAPVIIAGRDEWNVVAPYVGDRYLSTEYTYLWWPMQDYFNLQKPDGFLGVDWAKLYSALRSSQMRAALWEIWYNRDYRLYDQVTGRTHTLDAWPLRADFRLYIRRDVATQLWELSMLEPATELAVGEGAEISVTEPYSVGWQDLAARLVFGSPGQEPGQLQFPRGITVGPDGYVYVADTGNNRIQKFTADGQFVASFGMLSTIEMEVQGTPRGFLEPWDVAVAPDGSIYVADTWNHRIQRLDAVGNVLTFWGLFGQYSITDPGGYSAFYGPRGIAVGNDGNIYVADTGNKRIQVFAPDGQFLRQWGGGGALEGYLDEPVGIAIGPDDAIYVADTWNRRVQVFDANGNFLRQWPIAGWDTGHAEEKPYLAVDSRGNIYVTDPGHYRVLVFDRLGQYLLSFGKQGADERSFAWPAAIAVGQDGSIYVTDAHAGRVLVFEPPALAPTAAPTLLSPVAGAEVPAGTVTLSGSSNQPFSLVQVVIDGQAAGFVLTDNDGNWSHTVRLDEPGAHIIVLQALDTRGNVLAASDPITLTVVSAPVAPTAITLTLDLPAAGAQLPSGGVTLSGSGKPGAEIEILRDGMLIGITEVGAEGRWRYTLVPDAGEHQFVVRPSGVSTPSVAISATVAVNACVSPAGACTGKTYVIVPEDLSLLESLMECISRCAGVSLEALKAANPEITDPDRIVPGQVIRIPR